MKSGLLKTRLQWAVNASREGKPGTAKAIIGRVLQELREIADNGTRNDLDSSLREAGRAISNDRRAALLHEIILRYIAPQTHLETNALKASCFLTS